MIERYINADVFTSQEKFILVPAPIGETEFENGFIAQVVRRHPFVNLRLGLRGGVREGEACILDTNNIVPYKIAIVGIHRRQQEGWKDAPEFLQRALEPFEEFRQDQDIATAGIPGTGFSGLRGGADPEAIKDVLELAPLRFHVYQDGLAGDRAEVLQANPDLEDQVALEEV